MDLGLSDEEEKPAARRPSRSVMHTGLSPRKESGESISELLAGSKDSATMFGARPAAKKKPGSSLLSGMDPLDAFKSEFAKRAGNKPPPPSDDEEDLEFQREMQRQLEQAGLDATGESRAGAVAGSRSVSPAPAARTPPLRSPSPPAASKSGSDESLADIVGDILGDETGGRSKKRPAAGPSPVSPGSAPSSRAGSAPPRRAVEGSAGSQAGDWDDDDPPYAPRSRDTSQGPSAGSRPPRAGSRPPTDSALEKTPLSGQRGGFGPSTSVLGDSRLQDQSAIGFEESVKASPSIADSDASRLGGRRRIAAKSSVPDDDPLAEILGLGGGGGRSPILHSASVASGHDSGFGDDSIAGSAPFAVELAAKPKRRLGKPPSRPATPQQEVDDQGGSHMSHQGSGSGRATPVVAPAADRGTGSQQGSGSQSLSGSQLAADREASQILHQPVPSRGTRFPVEADEGDLDDLLMDNSSRKATPKAPSAAAAAPSAPSAPFRGPALGGGDSDNELPDFLRDRAPRARRGQRAALTPPTPPPKVGLDLGFDAEDFDPSDQSKSGELLAGLGRSPPASASLGRQPAAPAAPPAPPAPAAPAAASVATATKSATSTQQADAVHQTAATGAFAGRISFPIPQTTSIERGVPTVGFPTAEAARPAAARPADPANVGIAGAGAVSEPAMSLFGSEPPISGPGGYGGFSSFPPLAAVPSTDLLMKLAYSEAKVRQLELQLEECELRWTQRIADAKLQSSAEVERMELQCRRLEAEMDRNKEIHAGDIRHLQETKQLLMQSLETEKENARRDERRRAQLEVEKLRAEKGQEIEELRRKHERSLAIVQQQAELEAESLRRAQTGGQQLANLVEQVQGSAAEVERMSKRVESEKSLEWTVRERQLEARERNVKELESRLMAQSKEVEDQRRRVSELVRHMEASQVDDRASLAVERERLEAEHRRLLELQQSIRETERGSKEALKHAWLQLESEQRKLQQDTLKVDGELSSRKEEIELEMRHLKQEAERLAILHQQVEVARQNASRRIRDTEVTVANERRCLMHDLEIFEEKRRFQAQEAMKLESERKTFEEEHHFFEEGLRNVGLMATEVQRRSEEMKVLHNTLAEAKAEIQGLRNHLHEERSAQGSEFERLKTMQALVEQQRLQLLQTENQLRIRGIEDVDMLITTQASFPDDGPRIDPFFNQAASGWPSWPEPPKAMTVPAAMMSSGGSRPGPSLAATDELYKQFGGLAGRLPATAGRAGSRVELQTLLRRTREASGEMQVYIQEQCRFLRSVTGAEPAEPRSEVKPRSPTYAGDQPFAMRLPGQAPWLGASDVGRVPSEIGLLPLSGTSSSESDKGGNRFAGSTLEALRPLSSDLDASSAASGSSVLLRGGVMPEAS